MAGSADPSYNPTVQTFPIPDSDINEVQPDPMIDWASPAPGPEPALVDSLVGDDPIPPGTAFIRRVSVASGQADVLDPGA
jgi:hypothetical protein